VRCRDVLAIFVRSGDDAGEWVLRVSRYWLPRDHEGLQGHCDDVGSLTEYLKSDPVAACTAAKGCSGLKLTIHIVQ
jgi:hypothetical protein